MSTEVVNYHHYTLAEYDEEIRRVIPHHHEVHEQIKEWLDGRYASDECLEVLDLGAGTGLTSEAVRSVLPNAHLTVVDFSERMLNFARQRLGDSNVDYVQADYIKLELVEGKYDIVVSAIGLHHQTNVRKMMMFDKINRALSPNGAFIFADLVTYESPEAAALAAALHYHHLVENASSEKRLMEWAHHHMFLNKLAALEDHYEWLKHCRFKDIRIVHQHFQTALLIAIK